MSWEERLLFLMYLDYRGALKKWERNHNKYHRGSKVGNDEFSVYGGFCWHDTNEGVLYWNRIISQWIETKRIRANFKLLGYKVKHDLFGNTIEVGYQSITKKDALKIADFIYECFGEEV